MSSSNTNHQAWILGLALFAGLFALGFLLNSAAITMKEYERSVVVKGLSEKEYPADIIIWPIKFVVSGNTLTEVHQQLENNSQQIRQFFNQHQINPQDTTLAPPNITDKEANHYGGNNQPKFRYLAKQVFTVYSKEVKKVQTAMSQLTALSRQGVMFENNEYRNTTQYLFTRLNEIKPEMIEQATQNARQVALKFAEDSDSHLGKIKRASQGQFSIQARDSSSPHIKKVRVVSTVEYYLAD